MRLKRIRENYSRFLSVLSEAGINLTESQKSDLDSFVVGIESVMESQKKKTIAATKRIVENKMNAEFKQVFESFMKEMMKNQELTAKIQTKANTILESKKLTKDVSNYLDLYVESILPKKSIVDYDKLQKLEGVVESLRSTLIINDDDITLAKESMEKDFKKKKSALETEVAKLKVGLNESMAQNRKLLSKIEKFKSAELLESLTKDLPSFEARQIKKRLAESSCSEIQAKFMSTLKLVREEIEKSTATDEASIEEEVKEIIDGGDVSKKETKKSDKKKTDDEEAEDDEEETDSDEDTEDGSDEDDEDADDSDEESDDEDDEETTEESEDGEDGDELDESINAEQMKLWIMQANRLV